MFGGTALQNVRADSSADDESIARFRSDVHVRENPKRRPDEQRDQGERVERDQLAMSRFGSSVISPL